MSDFPANRCELLRASYTQSSANAICKGCSASIEWWKTKNGRSIPMNPMADDYAVATAHFITCPNAKDFKGAAANHPDAPKPAAGHLARKYSFDVEMESLCRRAKARVVALVDEFGTQAVWADGIPAEDLRHDLISAGNFVRNEIAKKEGTPAQ